MIDQVKAPVGLSNQACGLMLGDIHLALKEETKAHLIALMPGSMSMIWEAQGLVLLTLKSHCTGPGILQQRSQPAEACRQISMKAL